MSGGIVPAVAVLLMLLLGCGVEEAEARQSRKAILPQGFFGRWGEGNMEREVWFQKGSSALLVCRISRLQEILDSQPEANVTWLKDDLPLATKRAFVTPEGHLNITKLVRRRGRSLPDSDDGVYRCMLVLKNYMISAMPITLHVAELGRHVSVVPTNVSVLLGTVVRLSCHASSQPPALLQWQKNQSQLPQDARITEPTSGVIQITNVQESDAAIYRCLATNMLLNKTKISGDVTVTVIDPSQIPSHYPAYIPPSFVYPTSNHTIKVAERWDVTLECLATGIPLPSITWKWKGALTSEKSNFKPVVEEPNQIHFSGQGNLYFYYVNPRNAGRYECTATSQDPNTGKLISVSTEIKLVVVLAPRIIESPQNVTTLVAKLARINCSLHNSTPAASSEFYPVSEVVWYKNGIPFQMNTRIELQKKNQLVFVNSATVDTGAYQCIAINEAGYATGWSHLLVNSSQDHPPPPVNLRYKLTSPTSVFLEWDPDENTQNPVSAYSIHFIKHEPDGIREIQEVVQDNYHIIDNLKPNTNYSFDVRTYTSLASDPSEKVVFTTGEDVPTAVPEYLLEALSPSSIMVSWSPIPAEEARGTVIKYKIQYQQRGKDYYTQQEVNSDVFKFKLTKLHPGKTYKVRVLPSTKAGYNENGDWSWKSITLPIVNDFNVLPSAPQMTVRLNTDSSNKDRGMGIEVTWERNPEDDTVLEGYSLTYRKGNNPWVENIYLPPTSNSYIISGVEPDWYKIKLLGYNSEGEGTAAVEAFLAHNARDYGRQVTQMPTIAKVRLTPESQTIVRLSWEVAEVQSKPVVFYTVKQTLVSNSSYHEPVFARSTTKSIAIDGLVPFYTYEFRVRAHLSEKEFGLYSPPVQTNTMGVVPAAPKKLSYEPVDASSVELRWEISENPISPPNKYQIAYTSNKSIPLTQWFKEEVEGDVSFSMITGLVSNTEYWFRVRGCRNNACGAYSDSYPALIPAVLPNTSDSSKIYLIVGLALGVVILFLAATFTVYMFKFRGVVGGPILASNANGSAGGVCSGSNNHDDRGGCRSHGDGGGGGRNGISDSNGRELDYIPMLNRIHTDLPSTPLDTKGGYKSSRVNGFTNSKCNGVIREKDSHYGTNSNSKQGEENEELEHLFSGSRNGDLLSRTYDGQTSSSSAAEDEHRSRAVELCGDEPEKSELHPQEDKENLLHPEQSGAQSPSAKTPAVID